MPMPVKCWYCGKQDIPHYTRREYVPAANRINPNEKYKTVKVNSSIVRMGFCNTLCYENYMAKIKKPKQRKIARERNKGIVKIRNELLERDAYSCIACNSQEKLELAHVIPFSEKKEHNKNNMVVLCHECHNIYDRKSNSQIDKWVLTWDEGNQLSSEFIAAKNKIVERVANYMNMINNGEHEFEMVGMPSRN